MKWESTATALGEGEVSIFFWLYSKSMVGIIFMLWLWLRKYQVLSTEEIVGVIRAWGNFCLNLTILISSFDHGQCDFIFYLQFSLFCHCSGEFLLLLGKDLAFLQFIHRPNFINHRLNLYLNMLKQGFLQQHDEKFRKRWVCSKGFGKCF